MGEFQKRSTILSSWTKWSWKNYNNQLFNRHFPSDWRRWQVLFHFFPLFWFHDLQFPWNVIALYNTLLIATIYGHSVRNSVGMSNIRKLIGVCPQVIAPLFLKFLCQQHAQFKSIYSKIFPLNSNNIFIRKLETNTCLDLVSPYSLIFFGMRCLVKSTSTSLQVSKAYHQIILNRQVPSYH